MRETYSVKGGVRIDERSLGLTTTYKQSEEFINMTSGSDIKWRNGDWVEVKSPAEIAQTLDAEGTLDGLPFMPEMLEHCGQRYRVLRPAEKTCVEATGGSYLIREFHNNDVVLIEGLRCSGANHDQCQRLCMFFWKVAWMRKVENGQLTGIVELSGQEVLRSKLKTIKGTGRYFCQSTELANATKPLTRRRILLKCFEDIRSGSRGFFEMAGLVLMPLLRKLSDSLFGRHRLEGTLTRTPVGNLGLRPGELVVVKPLTNMKATLDRRGRNRGLICDPELHRFAGKQYRVRCRLERMISEPTGEMKQIEATVILDGITCLCPRVIGGCPRQDYGYWREVWLERPISIERHEDPA